MNLMSGMDKYLNILESPRQEQASFDAKNVRVMNSKISMWDFYGVLQEEIPESITNKTEAITRE